MVFSTLLVWYINNLATDGKGGAVDGRHGDNCKRNIGPGLKSQPGKNSFSLFFVQIHTHEFIQLLYKLYCTNLYAVWFLYQFIQLFYKLYSTNSYKVVSPAAPTFRVLPAAPTFRVHPAAPAFRVPRLTRYTNLYIPIRIIPILVGCGIMATDGGGGGVVAEVEFPTWSQFFD